MGEKTFEELRGIYEACTGWRIPEGRAVELLQGLIGAWVDRDGTKWPVLSIITADRDGAEGAESSTSPFFNRIMPVVKVEAHWQPKVVEWENGTVERVNLTVWSALSEPYTTRDQRRVQDEVRSGPEVIAKREDGSISQYGAAVALLARLLEPAVWIAKDQGADAGRLVVPVEMMAAYATPPVTG